MSTSEPLCEMIQSKEYPVSAVFVFCSNISVPVRGFFSTSMCWEVLEEESSLGAKFAWLVYTLSIPYSSMVSLAGQTLTMEKGPTTFVISLI